MKGKSTLLFLVVALLLAAVAAYGARTYIATRAAQAAKSKLATKSVVVAAVSLDPGTEITAEHLTMQKWPVESIPKGVFYKNKGLLGRVVPNGLLKGEPLMISKLAPEGAEGGMSAVVAEGMRAVTVKVDDVIGVAGYVKKGDRVDVLATASTGAFNKDPAAKLILQDVEVLAVQKNPEQPDAKKRTGRRKEQVVTLTMNPTQIEQLALAASQGHLLLALRNQTDRVKAKTKGVLLTSLFPNPLPKKEREQIKAKVVRKEPMVEIIRGADISRQILN